MKNTWMRFSIVTLSLGALALGVAYSQAPAGPPAGAPPATGAGAAGGQGGRGAVGAGWDTPRGDAQRSAWVTSDSLISVENFRTPNYFGLEWTVKVGQNPREILSEGVSQNTTQLNPQPGDIAGSGNNIYGYEINTGAITWAKHFDGPVSTSSSAVCPGGSTSGVTRTVALNRAVAGIGAGRGGGPQPPREWRSGVGQPGQGLPPELVVGRGGRGPAAPAAPGAPAAPAAPGAVAAGAAPAPFAPPNAAAAPAAPAGPARGGLRGQPMTVYMVTSDGILHGVGQAQGKEIAKPLQFVPANANVSGITLIENTMYASTINGCGGVANGVWAMDTTTGTVTSWKSGASPAGMIAFSTQGTLFVAIGDGTAGANGYSNAVIALNPKTLAVQDWFTLPGASFSSTPVIFNAGAKQLLAVAAKDGRVFLMDTASLGGSDHKTALAVSAATNTSKTWSPTALTTWEASEKRYVALAGMGAKGNITAFEVNGNALTRAWTSSTEMAAPSSPITVNNVVFAVNHGTASTPAVLYAFDAATGKEIWNSGSSIKSYVRSTPLWAINGHVHVATADNTVYAFGTAMGRHL